MPTDQNRSYGSPGNLHSKLDGPLANAFILLQPVRSFALTKAS